MIPRLLFPAIIFLAIGCGGNDNKADKSEGKESADKATVTNDNANTKHIFDIKAAKIVFNYTGGPETGAETLYFDDYGNVAVLVVDKKTQFGRNHQTMIWQDKKSTIINHENKTVAKSSFRSKATEPPGIADVDDKTKNNIGYEKQPDESIAGKNCEVWFNSKQNIKYWLWKKIDLKLQNQGVYTKEATSVEEIAEIPASLMEIPKDYKQ